MRSVAVNIVFFLFVFHCLNIFAMNDDRNNASSNVEEAIIIDIGANRAPFTVLLSNGQPTGLYVEFWLLWSKYNDIPVEFQVNGFLNIQKNLATNVIDFQSGLFKSSQREQWADFSTPFHRVDTGLYYLRSATLKPTLEQFNQSGSHMIAVHRDSFQEQYLREHFPNIPLVLYKEASDIFDQVINGEVTAVFAEQPYMDAQIAGKGLRGLFVLGHSKVLANEVYAIVAKGNSQLLEKINTGINAIPVAEIIALERKWLPESETFFTLSKPGAMLTGAELEWIKSLPNLKLGIDVDWYPYDFLDENSEHSGLSADYMKFLTDNLPIELETQNDLSWVESFEKLKQGKVDLLSAVVRTEERDSFLDFTEPYAVFPSVIATYKDSIFVQNMDSLNGRKLGVEKGLILEDVFRKNHPKINILAFENHKKVIDALISGEVDAVVADLISINRLIVEDKLTNISIAAFTPYELKLSIGVRKGLEPLVSILNKTLARMNEKQKARIANAWFGSKKKEKIDYQAFLVWLIPITLIFLLIVSYVGHANNTLREEISERLKIEKSLEKEKEKSDLANQAKNNFLANMSHEIRTPMNAVVGMSDLLEQTCLNEEQQKYVNTIQFSAASLLVIINDILDLSKIEAGKLELEQHYFSLRKLIDAIFSQVSLEVEQKQVSIEVEISDSVPDMIFGDSTRLGQILINLIHNAIKFTSQGKIIVNVDEVEKDFNGIGLLFCVKDTGIGIAPEVMNKLFQSYGQADSSTTRIYGGTGLGLSICKQLSKIMDGDIWVESEPGVGSEFFFTVFFKMRDKKLKTTKTLIDHNLTSNSSRIKIANKKNETENSLSDLSILLVDDNQVNLFIAEKMLTAEGANVVTAENGQVAIDKIKVETFDAILMDIQMPIMDGYQATKIIRKQMGYMDLPIIAITANVLEADVKMVKDVGMDAHIGKPLDRTELIQLVKILTD